LERLNASFSLATKVQLLLLDPEPVAGVVGAGAGADGAGAEVTAVSTAPDVLLPVPLASLPPPQPANRTATEQKSKCTGFN
jgi:hypothetical protein